MSRNPYRRVGINGSVEAEVYSAQVLWESVPRLALRLRWAARHACRRLRAERDEARRTLESVLAQDRRWAAWARELGANYGELREVLWPYQEGDASFGWVVERIRDLVRAAAEKEKERADLAEAKLARVRALRDELERDPWGRIPVVSRLDAILGKGET